MGEREREYRQRMSGKQDITQLESSQRKFSPASEQDLFCAECMHMECVCVT